MGARRNYYSNSNLAHDLNTFPQEERFRTPSRRVQRRPKQKAVKEIGVSLASLIVLTMAIVVSLYVCVSYLKTYTQVKEMEKEIIILENTLKEIKDKNNYNLELITSKLDYEYIYNFAVGQLGMVYPNNNKVINYDKVEKDLVKQYKDIPKTDDQILDDVIRSILSKNN